ncbi:MAG: Dipeptide transport system permease protein DppB [Chloroflexi bacterium]|nr:Dipeptide transport system permease protein DppB [Chloroflexota bacterium]
MTKYIIKRLFRGLITLITFQSILFGLIQILPYDFTAFLVLSPLEQRLAQSTLGLDHPGWQQYLIWLNNFFHLDLGKSFLAWPTPVHEIIFATAPRTLLLFLSAAILAYFLGISLGKIIAWNRGGWLEFSLTLGGVASYTSFAPFLGFVILNVFGRYLHWFPYRRLVDHTIWFDAPVSVSWVLSWVVITALFSVIIMWGIFLITRGFGNTLIKWGSRLAGLSLIGSGIWIWWNKIGHGKLALDILYHLALPLSTVVLMSFGETMLLMRTTMLETLTEEYVLMAKAKGLPPRVIRDKHVARNAFLPVLTRLLLNLPFVLTGSLAIEIIFNWRAMGTVVFQAIEYQDIPLIMGILSLVGALTLLGHIFLDILYLFLDPRLRYAERK